MEDYKNSTKDLPVILLVEDDAAHATLVTRTFERLGISGKIDWVKDGKEALDYLQMRESMKTDHLPNLIILDLRLPKLDGHEVLQKIKTSEKLEAIPVVVLTTSSSDEDVLKAYINHANSYLVKPVGFDKLQESLEEMGTYWLEWNTDPVKIMKNEP